MVTIGNLVFAQHWKVEDLSQNERQIQRLHLWQAIQAVRTHELKAYIIYVKPPTLERLRESRKSAHITTSYYVNRPFQVKFTFCLRTQTAHRSRWLTFWMIFYIIKAQIWSMVEMFFVYQVDSGKIN